MSIFRDRWFCVTCACGHATHYPSSAGTGVAFQSGLRRLRVCVSKPFRESPHVDAASSACFIRRPAADDAGTSERESPAGQGEGLTTPRKQWDVAWVNYVHDQFKDQNSPSDVRRRRLVLSLPDSKNPVQVSKLPMLNPQIAMDYNGRTGKTLVRDLNALLTMGLIFRQRGHVFAKKELILAFLPWRNPEMGKLGAD
jgi:hypothetical protein